MAVQERTVPVEYGVVHFDACNRLQALDEKPDLKFNCSMGVYALEPEVCDLIGESESIDFPDLFVRIMDRGGTVGVYRHEGYWRESETGTTTSRRSRTSRPIPLASSVTRRAAIAAGPPAPRLRLDSVLAVVMLGAPGRIARFARPNERWARCD